MPSFERQVSFLDTTTKTCCISMPPADTGRVACATSWRMQMRFRSLIACAALAALSSPAFAEIEDCFPQCAQPESVAPPQSGEGLCQFGVVREAARINHDLA